ncbi:olfactory receptor 11L1-like [Gastrophryne carolinensis]
MLIESLFYVVNDVNRTTVTEFILLAFSSLRQFQLILFMIILLSYIGCILGNCAILILVKCNCMLHTPMYFFISTFAFLEITFVSVTIPKLLGNLVQASRKISFRSCFVQLFAFNSLGVTECYLLAVMAFDRDLAINNPLLYHVIMSKKLCVKLAVSPWIIGAFTAFIPTIFTIQLEFCGPNKVNHFFCDLAPMQNLACSNPFVSNLVTCITAVFATVVPFLIILGFYVHIIHTILKIKTLEGKQKAFSTCSSHLIVASLFYCTAIVVYVRPKGGPHDKFLALMYTVFIPLLNPFIYSFRNNDVKVALRKALFTKNKKA